MARAQGMVAAAADRVGECIDEMVGCWATLSSGPAGDRLRAWRRLARAALRLLRVARVQLSGSGAPEPATGPIRPSEP